MPHASGYFRTSYERDLALLDTRTQKAWTVALVLALGAFPFLVGPFALDLANQVFLSSIGAVSLMLLTGYAGQISLGHAGLLAAGAFATGILVREVNAAFWVTLPAAAALGALLGFIFGLPSLRLRGLYLAVSTLALHFIVIYLGGEYETKRGFSTGIVIDPPRIGGWSLTSGRAWYFVLLVFALLNLLFALNLLRCRTGRAWRALHGRDTVAEALGIPVPLYKLAAFVVSSTLTSVAGALFAYYRGFVSAEAFSMFVSIQYIAMTIIGGMGSLLGALLGTVFVVLFPYAIETLMGVLPTPAAWQNQVFAVNYAAFGVVMILFLVFEPHGLVGIWRRIQNWALVWPLRRNPFSGTGG
ncbi:MAG: branched-chain amino acid ABC transporter permease [Deltaproteobacteria bacterium]|nr:branched-chain amino acid ABC transporter permease [Deltaproteobacteria bacterium]